MVIIGHEGPLKENIEQGGLPTVVSGAAFYLELHQLMTLIESCKTPSLQTLSIGRRLSGKTSAMLGSLKSPGQWKVALRKKYRPVKTSGLRTMVWMVLGVVSKERELVGQISYEQFSGSMEE
jgi:hypothetical protein